MDVLGVPGLWLRGHLKQPNLINSLEIYGAVPQQLLAGLVARLVNSGLLSGCNYWYAQVWWSRTHLEREVGKLSSSPLLFRSDWNNGMHHFSTGGTQLGIWLQVNWLVNLVIKRFKGIPSPVNAFDLKSQESNELHEDQTFFFLPLSPDKSLLFDCGLTVLFLWRCYFGKVFKLQRWF